MDKVTKVNCEGHDYGFVAGNALKGVSGALASDYVKIITLSEGADLVEGCLLAVTFVNGNSAGFTGTQKAYSSNGTVFYSDPAMTEQITLPPQDCYTMTLVSGTEYDYKAFVCLNVNGVTVPFCDSKSIPQGGSMWAAGDTVTMLYMGNKFVAILSTVSQVAQGVDVPPTSDAVYNAIDALDVPVAGGSGHYIESVSEENGKINAVSKSLQTIFDMLIPVGFIYTQYPKQPSPNDLWGSYSTWTKQSYGGAFFRSEGGAAIDFNGTEKSLAITTSTSYSVTSHGLSVGQVIYDFTYNEATYVTEVTNANAFKIAKAFTHAGTRTVLISQKPQNYTHNHGTATTKNTINTGNTNAKIMNASLSCASEGLFNGRGAMTSTKTAFLSVSGSAKYCGGDNSDSGRPTTMTIDAQHRHQIDIPSSGGVDLRSANLTVIIWKRTA